MIAASAVYIIGLIVVYSSIFVSALSNYRGRFFLILSIVILGSLAIFRGSVGTDTAMYEAIVSLAYSPNYNWGGREIGFVAFVEFFSIFISSEVVVVRLFAVFFVSGLLLISRYADENEIYFLLALFIPAQFYDYSMNVVRIGMATIFILCGMQLLRRNKFASGLFVMTISIFFHYSAIISVIFVVLSTGILNAKRMMVFGGFFASLIFLFVLFFGNYLEGRFSAYSDYHPPGILSGLSDVLVLLFIIIASLLSSLRLSSRLIFFTVSVVFVAISILVSRYSVAGMRMLDLLVLSAPVSLMILHGNESIKLNWKVRFLFLFSGFLGAASILRNFISSAGVGRSPWIPYESLINPEFLF